MVTLQNRDPNRQEFVHRTPYKSALYAIERGYRGAERGATDSATLGYLVTDDGTQYIHQLGASGRLV